MGMQKLLGCSWFEVDGVVHEFLVGDTSHPMSPKIYKKLESLFKELREVGYSPTTEFVFFDIEEKEKEYFLGCHSEKLAVAFSLINIGANNIIRVVKNLCVCGDCHEAIKLISKFTGRKITIRDNNRFHCFSGVFIFFFCNTPYAKHVFSQSKNPNICLFNTMIHGTVSNDSFDDAVLFYNSMHSARFLPDNYTFTFVLKACARLADFSFGIKLYSPVEMGFDYDVFVKTSLVCLYSKCGYVKDARKVVDVFLRRMLFRGLLLSVGILGVAFTRKQLLGDLASGEWIDNYITESGFHRNVFVLISSVDLYAKCGSIEKAL
ncbi:hypothetical protein Ahy_A07g033940 [Arachis hypogaea]|uniref:DYW domain-containing protein n=1 Tax=Arachis hypogaea TaxID=3818 RepID=A0A445CAH6_ARAHY|nr:hypothetical protein Ahy_A07g033940 [Arachis hypogaea]